MPMSADKEGFPVIASHFRAIAQIEQHHLDRFQTYLDQLQKGTIWKREKPILWQCLVCGYIYEGTEPPVKCLLAIIRISITSAWTFTSNWQKGLNFQRS